jgi:hypothetical protein
VSRSAPRLTARGLAVFALFGLVVATATATDTPELAPLAVVVGIPLLLGPWLAGRRAQAAWAGAEFHAHVDPATAGVRGSMHLHLSVTHRAQSRASLPPLGLPPTESRWRNRGPATGSGQRGSRLAPAMGSLLVLPTPAPGRTATCRIPVPTGRRGVFELPEQTTWTTDPFGLFGAAGPSTPVVTAVVHPLPIPPREPPPELKAPLSGADRLGPSRIGAAVGDLEGIRPYVVGDRLSLLHWPAKARYGSWFVRQFGTEGAVAISFVIDDRPGVHRRREFEQLVATTLWILTEAAETGRVADLLTLSGRRYTFGTGELGRAEVRLVLAELQPSGTATSPLPPAVPHDAVLLTTRTGADRLVPPRAGGTDVDLPGSRVVVV